jgi:hypothetical protein
MSQAFANFAKGVELGVGLRQALQNTQVHLQDRADKAAAEQVAKQTVEDLKRIEAPFEAHRQSIRSYNADVSDGKRAPDRELEVRMGSEFHRLQRQKAGDRVNYFMNTLSANQGNPYVVEASQIQLTNEMQVFERLDMQAARMDQMSENTKARRHEAEQTDIKNAAGMERIQESGTQTRQSATHQAQLTRGTQTAGHEQALERIDARAESKGGGSNPKLGHHYVNAKNDAVLAVSEEFTDKFGRDYAENEEFQKVHKDYADAYEAAGQQPPSAEALRNLLIEDSVNQRMDAAFPNLAGQEPGEVPQQQTLPASQEGHIGEDPILQDFLKAGIITEEEHREAQDESANEQLNRPPAQTEAERVYGKDSFMAKGAKAIGGFVDKTAEHVGHVFGESSVQKWDKLKEKRAKMEEYQKALDRAKKRLDEELTGSGGAKE